MSPSSRQAMLLWPNQGAIGKMCFEDKKLNEKAAEEGDPALATLAEQGESAVEVRTTHSGPNGESR